MKQKLTSLAATVLSLILILPAAVLGADVTLNLKDIHGANFTDFANITFRLLDGIGSVVQEVPATSSSQTFTGLTSAESYTAVVKHHKVFTTDQNGSVTYDNSYTKSIRFNADNETLNRDFFITDPVATNVLVRMLNVPTTWTSAKVTLTPIESSKQQIDKTEIVFSATPVAGNAEVTIASMPAIRYNWVLSNQDGSETYAGSDIKTARRDATLSLNTNLAKSPGITLNFSLKNPDRTARNFAGETIHIDILDATNAVVQAADFIANGVAPSWTSQTLANAQYTVNLVMSNGGAIKRESTRTVNLTTGPKSTNVSLTALNTVNIDFLVRDSRTGVALTSGSLKILDSKGNVIEDIPVTGATITRPMVYGYQYTLDASSAGYTSRSAKFFPRESQVKEVTLMKVL